LQESNDNEREVEGGWTHGFSGWLQARPATALSNEPRRKE